jgi:hypothetical protein
MDANRSLDLLGFTIDFNTVDFHRQRMHLQRFVPSLYCQSGGVLPPLWKHCLQDAVGGAVNWTDQPRHERQYRFKMCRSDLVAHLMSGLSDFVA